MAIDPANYVKKIDNPYWPLTPGKTFVFESQTDEGTIKGTFHVTHNTVVNAGVTCVEVIDTETLDGVVIEKTRDWFAQDKDGNIWYFGEYSKQYENGKFVSTEGSWQAGVDGAKPGIIMQANPQVGQVYKQEVAPGIAEDKGEVLSVDVTKTFRYGGTFHDILQIREFSPLDPDLQEQKFYAKGVGHLLTIDLLTGETEELVKIKVEGRSGSDKLTGFVGPDALFGRGGKDVLDGAAGSDKLNGGRGADRFVFKDLQNGLAETDLIADYKRGKDKIDLPDGIASVAGDAFADGVWQITLAGDGDVIRFAGVKDKNGDGHIADDLLIV